MSLNWDDVNAGYAPLVEFEQQLLHGLEKLMEETHAPAGALPYLLRRLHAACHYKARQMALQCELNLGLPDEQRERFMTDIYPGLLQTARQAGFDDVGPYMAYCTAMGLTNPIAVDDSDNPDH